MATDKPKSTTDTASVPDITTSHAVYTGVDLETRRQMIASDNASYVFETQLRVHRTAVS